MKKKHSSFFSKLRHKYRLIIYNDNTFEEVLHFRLSRWNVGIMLVIGSFIIIVITTILIAYTPLKMYIPGYPDSEAIQKARYNEMFVDSIQEKMAIQEKYLNNLKFLLLNEEPITKENISTIDTTKNYKNLMLEPSPEDAEFRKKVEQEERYSISTDKTLHSLFVQNHYFVPVKGVITNKFNKNQKHFGIDIVTKAKDMIHSILDGYVIYSGFTNQSGNIIIIQHKENLLSTYKHLEQILVSAGEKVAAGSVIGIVGNTGELTTGPHLHFELWYKGQAINPENVMTF